MNKTSAWSMPGMAAIVSLALVLATPSGDCQALQNPAGTPPKTARTPQQETPMDEVLKLPMDPETVVFQLAFTGGYRMRQPAGFESTPRLRVYADGRVVTGKNRPDQEEFEIRLDDSRLHAFMKEVVNGLDFFSIDAGDIGKAIAATGRPISIVDVPSTEVVVRLADREHEVKVFAANFCAGAYPEIESLQRLVKIEKRAQWMAAIAQLGGQEVLESLIEHGNSEMLKGKFPERKLGADNLESSRRIDKTTFEARFVIRFREGQKMNESLLTVTVEYSPVTGPGKVTTYFSSAHD